jgi:SWI/SNF-related matrix-associated actin-dependent regulator 1 of chromatin subfamily A
MDDSVPDTPIRGKKLAPGTPDDDGDYETIATLPAHTITPSQRLTQATQLIDMPYSRSNNTIVQVAASSPTALLPPHPPTVPAEDF